MILRIITAIFVLIFIGVFAHRQGWHRQIANVGGAASPVMNWWQKANWELVLVGLALLNLNIALVFPGWWWGVWSQYWLQLLLLHGILGLAGSMLPANTKNPAKHKIAKVLLVTTSLSLAYFAFFANEVKKVEEQKKNLSAQEETTKPPTQNPTQQKKSSGPDLKLVSPQNCERIERWVIAEPDGFGEVIPTWSDEPTPHPIMFEYNPEGPVTVRRSDGSTAETDHDAGGDIGNTRSLEFQSRADKEIKVKVTLIPCTP